MGFGGRNDFYPSPLGEQLIPAFQGRLTLQEHSGQLSRADTPGGGEDDEELRIKQSEISAMISD